MRTLLAAILVLLSFMAYHQHEIVENQKAQMSQQFHGDQVAIFSILGNDGLKKLTSNADPDTFTKLEGSGLAFLVQRIFVAHTLHERGALSPDRYETFLDDARATLKLKAMQNRWQGMSKWYPKSERDLIDSLMPQK